MPLPHQTHSDTSLQAAIRFAGRAPAARARVHSLLVSTPDGLTDEELQDGLRMGASTERPRRIELERGGLVADSGRTRPTRSGAQAVVWVATGVPYPDRWPTQRTVAPTLTGRAKALHEIREAIPEAQRSPELLELIEYVEYMISEAARPEQEWDYQQFEV